MELDGKTIAIIATDYFEESELLQPKAALERAGAVVEVYSQHRGEIQAVESDSQETAKVAVDGTFDEVDVEITDCILVPGGTINADNIRTDEDAQEIVRQADDTGKLMAVICHGPWLLVSAGLVDGRRLTSYPSLKDDIKNAGGEWVDEEVVIDDNLITSRNPHDIPAFIDAIVAKLTEKEEE